MPRSQFNLDSTDIDTTSLCPESYKYLNGLHKLSMDKSESENLPKILNLGDLVFRIGDTGKAEVCKDKQLRKREILEKLIVLEEKHKADDGLSHQPPKSRTDKEDSVTSTINKNAPPRYSILGSIFNWFRVNPNRYEQLNETHNSVKKAP